MAQPLFDFDLKRVSHKHYITGKTEPASRPFGLPSRTTARSACYDHSAVCSPTFGWSGQSELHPAKLKGLS